MYYLKLFQNHSDYQNFVSGSTMLNPNVSHCAEENEVHYTQLSVLKAKFMVTDADTETSIRIGGSMANFQSAFTSIEIDGVERPITGNAYKFKTTGEHIVKYTLRDPSILTGYCLRGAKFSEIEIPKTVRTISDAVFSGCTSLTSVEIPNGVTTIGDYAFTSCSGLTSVTIPDSVTSMGNVIFRYCGNLSSVKLPGNITSLGSNIFTSCNSLSGITIPNKVQSIGNRAFEGCSGLTSIEIPNGVTSIGDYCFQNCTSLTSITIPDSVTTLGTSSANYVFNGCTSLPVVNGIRYADTCAVAAVDKNLAEYTFKNNIRFISSGAFKNCTALKTLTIPGGVASITNYAFSGCTGLNDLNIPNNVETVGYGAFSGCTSITGLTINSNSVTTIYNTLGNNVKNTVVEVTIGDNITDITQMFQGCSALKKVRLGNGITSIGCKAFTNSGIESIGPSGSGAGLEIPSKVISIGDIVNDECNYDGVFRTCTYLTSITIPNTVTFIAGNAFSDCTALANVTLGNGISTINYNMFANCSSLTNITIPNSVTSIGAGVFQYCTNLTSVAIPNSVTSIEDYAFCGDESLNASTIAAIQAINPYSFECGGD